MNSPAPRQAPLYVAVTGMTCASCAQHVERALTSLSGVDHVVVNLTTETASLYFTEPLSKVSVNAQAILDKVQASGYNLRLTTIELDIEGMTCASCVGHVEKALLKITGVVAVNVNLATAKASVQSITSIPPSELIQAVQESGYQARPSNNNAHNSADDSIEARSQKDIDGLKLRFWVALCATLPLFMVEMGGHLFPALHHWLFSLIELPNLWAIEFLLASLVMFGPGLSFYRSGIPALFRLAPDMNSLVTLGTLAAWAYSLVATFMPNLLPASAQHVYYEAAATIITLILLGRLLEARAKGRTSEAISALIKLQPKTASCIRDGKEIQLPLESLQVNDLVLVRPGEKIPLDGVIVSGESYVDESMMTGEPNAIKKEIDAQVIGGTLNKAGSFTFKVTRIGDETLLAQIIRLVETAQASKLPIQALVDKITLWFVPLVIAAALLTFCLWLAFGPSFQLALINAVAVLIIACPCAMGLATPTSIMVATGRAANMGLLFRKGSALQALADVKIVAFDKTGTLTKGEPELTDFILSEDVNKDTNEDDILALVAAAEAPSEHPLALALVTAANARHIKIQRADSFNSITGSGLEAVVSNKKIHVGGKSLFASLNISLDAFSAQANNLSLQGKTPIYIAIDGKAVAIMALADTLKASSKAAIASLHHQGYQVAMISGDNIQTATFIGKELGIDQIEGEVLPDQKVSALKKLRAQWGEIAFVGDGVNDAPALAEADLGIAIGTGTDIAIESADLVIVSGDPLGVAKSLALAKATMRNIKQNLFWAFAYNAALIPLAAGLAYPNFGILLSPVVAAAAMALSSVFVVTNALRLKTINLEI